MNKRNNPKSTAATTTAPQVDVDAHTWEPNSILASVAGFDESAARSAFTTALVALESVERGAIIGTILARRAIGAVCERFYSLKHGKAPATVSAAITEVPADVRDGKSDSFLKLAVRTNRLWSDDRYLVWSDACGTDIANSDPAAFKRNADAWLRWADADANGRTDRVTGAVIAVAGSNRSGTSSKPAPNAGETAAAYRARLATLDAQAATERTNRVMSREKVGRVSRTTIEQMSDEDLSDLQVMCAHLLAVREAARKVAAAAAKDAEKSAPDVKAEMAKLSDEDMADYLAWKAAKSAA